MLTTTGRLAIKFCLILLIFPAFNYSKPLDQGEGDNLEQLLSRGIQHWQEGRPVQAFVTLDSINNTTADAANAGVKISASLQTARYLQAQRKFNASYRFLDSALVWGQQYGSSAEVMAAYELYSEIYLSVNNVQGAMASREAARKIADSLSRVSHQALVDSLETVIDTLAKRITGMEDISNRKTSAESGEAARLTYWVYGLTAACVILLIILFLVNGQLQRIRRLPPAPASYTTIPAQPLVVPPVTPRVPEVPVIPKEQEQTQPEERKAAVTETTPTESPATLPSPASRNIAVKLREVELVLINPGVLALYNNGEPKAIRNLLQDYLTKYGALMKELDEAIVKNEAAPILNILHSMMNFLEAFGMQVSIKLVKEIEEDAPREKVAKLLSRVFQVRNHCRRAADEAKALLEKLS